MLSTALTLPIKKPQQHPRQRVKIKNRPHKAARSEPQKTMIRKKRSQKLAGSPKGQKLCATQLHVNRGLKIRVEWERPVPLFRGAVDVAKKLYGNVP